MNLSLSIYSNTFIIDLFQEAMQKGYVVLQTTVLLLIGVAGAGKTTFCRLLFNEPPPKVRRSTPIAQSSIRAMSLTKVCVHTESGPEDIVWERITAEKLNILIADGIKGIHTYGVNLQVIPAEVEIGLKYRSSASKNVSISSSNNIISIQESSVIESTEQNIDTSETVGDSNPVQSDIDQLLETKHVKQLLDILASAKGSGEIFKRKWLYIIDTGGQPQFHELLPTFVHHVSAAVFFVKLNEVLSEHPMIEYYKDGKRCNKPYKSPCNHLQILQNCLQAMQSRNQMSNTSQYPKLLFVGTHRDKEKKAERLDLKNAQLLEMLLQHDIFRDNLVYYSLGQSDQLLYPVNAKKPNKKDREIAADFRHKVMSQCQTQEYKIPIGWFVLEQLLQDLSKDGIVSFDKCLEVAGHLGMNEEQLIAALEYLVKLNIFEYYSTVLPKVVFTTSQVLLNKITELVEHSHLLRDVSTRKIDASDLQFRDHGIINVDMLRREKFSSHYVSGLFEPQDLLDLWVELLVVAKGNDGDFVVPAVLPDLSQERVSEYLPTDSSEVIPIAFHYPGGFFPSGIFSSLVSYLQNKCSDWDVSIKHGKPACLFKNCINFSISGRITANVTLIYRREWIELHVKVYGKDKKKICMLRDEIFESLKNAEAIQKYGDLTPELAFICPYKHKDSTFIHLASPVTPDNEVMRCRQDQTIYSDLTEKYILWLESTDGNFS